MTVRKVPARTRNCVYDIEILIFYSCEPLTVTTMPSIPIDVLREILEHVREADLATLCRVNKIFCSCSQNVLYREINGGAHAIQTLATSTDLARRVRSFETTCLPPELATALRNMSSLRSLDLYGIGDDASILDGCTFKLETFSCDFPYSESLQKFLNSQPSITHVILYTNDEPLPPFDERCLPNLTRIEAIHSLLRILIPGRPVREAVVTSPLDIHPIDLSFFTLSTTPIQKLWIYYDMLYPKPVSLLVSIFSSLVHLEVDASYVEWIELVRLCLSI
jgi:F-box domain